MMSDKIIVEFCAPTLAGIKTANLFTCDYHSKSQVREDIRRINRILVKKGIKVLPVRYSNHRVLIYVYRPSFLKKDLCDKDTVNAKNGVDTSVMSILPQFFTKAEMLAFLFAVSFNMPCVMAMSTTYKENHSKKWTAIIAVYYIAFSLVLALIAYHLGNIIFS